MRFLYKDRRQGDFLFVSSRSALAGMLVLSVIACNSSQSATLDHDDLAIKMVEAANETAPPIKAVQPDPLLPEDIRRHDLAAPSCTFALGTNLAPRVIAREADAYMKFNGKIHRFAADPGARHIMGSVRSIYNGRAHVLRLELDGSRPGDGSASQGNTEGLIELRDPHGRIVYSGQGVTECS